MTNPYEGPKEQARVDDCAKNQNWLYRRKDLRLYGSMICYAIFWLGILGFTWSSSSVISTGIVMGTVAPFGALLSLIVIQASSKERFSVTALAAAIAELGVTALAAVQIAGEASAAC
ncbi:hypothetical protein [Haloferula sargassicola]|uniref:hypothetical protein n=1 Tax=Haloferula sargassicola TaxID=490096 RepID=UPI003365440B